MQERVSKIFPTLRSAQSEVVAHALCTFFLHDYPWISAALMNNYAKFKLYCKCRLKIPISATPSVNALAFIEDLWAGLKTVLIPILEEVKNQLPDSISST